MATLLSLNVGLPKTVPWGIRSVYTGVWKSPVQGARKVRRLNIDGDGQGDLGGHGGENRAVLVYQVESYRHWRDHFCREDIEFGAFGENFTVEGLGDDQVCIGDRFRIGDAEFEVTQPRVTCFRVGMRLGEPDLPALLVAHHRPGFYLRVLTEGEVRAGDEIFQIGEGPQRMTVAEIDALLYLPHRETENLRRALRIPALSAGWQGSFRELLDTAAGPRAAATVRGDAAAGWPGFRQLRVRDAVVESATITSFLLDAPDATPLPPARPGQYLTLRLADAGTPAPARGYSLSSAPGAAGYRISVKREPHGLVSRYLHSSVRPGALVEVAAPRGDFVLEDGENPVVLVSAGVGVTPVLAMLHALAGQHTSREVWWLHAARRPGEHAFGAEAHGLLAGLDRAHEHVFYTAASPAELAATGADGGRLDTAALAGLGLPVDATAYVCGPAAFMADIREGLATLGITDVHTELFGALGAINPGVVGEVAVPPHPPAGPPGTGPLITFARSGLAVPFDDSTSLLELAEACDVPTRWSCRTGVCHMCVTPLLSGRVSYRPEPLEPPAEGSVLICCSSPDSELVLDM
ncbi:MAG TPA: MOSC and FAD-binding oxidoreductase domain-containing protein [Pseudonocardia sp.]|jgi:ferredoxin-NADP reductase/MOSC domain-containing protein YiiM|nr:MOSC and FAD-binding oxidoreductase domain-containing protein [Pseudonocardia sp.]